jgi:hypothetical protein
MTVLVILVDAMLVGMILYVRNFEEKPLIKRTSPMFLYMLLSSGIVFCTSSLLFVTAPSLFSNVCSLRVWLISLSFLGFVTPLTVKSHHFVLEFRGAIRRRRRFPEELLYKYNFFMLLVQAVLNLVFLGVIDPIKVEYQQLYLNPDVDFTKVEVCSSSFPHLALTFIYCFGLMIWILSLAYETRFMNSKFNEVMPLFISCGFTLIYGLLIVGIQFMLAQNPTPLGVLRVISILIGVMVVAGSVVGPKILKLNEDPDWDPPSLDSQGNVIQKTKQSGGTQASRLKNYEGKNTSVASGVSDSDDE